MMKKYYRSRYATLLKTIYENKQKKEEDIDKIRKKEENRKQKLKDDLGIGNI